MTRTKEFYADFIATIIYRNTVRSCFYTRPASLIYTSQSHTAGCGWWACPAPCAEGNPKQAVDPHTCARSSYPGSRASSRFPVASSARPRRNPESETGLSQGCSSYSSGVAAGVGPVSDYLPQFGFTQGAGFTDTVRMACSYEKHFSFVIQVCMSVKHVV